MASLATETVGKTGSTFSYRRQILNGIDNDVIADINLERLDANNGQIPSNIQSLTPISREKKFHHQIDTKLLQYSKTINQHAFVAFAAVIFLNFAFFLMYCVIIRRVFLFPITEYLYFDIENDYLSLILHTINWILLISVILTQILLQEMYINWKAVLKTITMFFLLNLFGTINSILIMYPIVTVLNYTYYYRFKSRISYFINNIIPIDPASNKNDKYLRLIAINHFLSKLCYKLQKHSLNKENKHINNSTIYDKLHRKLDEELIHLSEHDSNDTFRAESLYQKNIESEINKQRIYHRLTFRLYAIAINISMVRLLFYSKGLDLYHDHFYVYCAFFGKLGFECLICVGIMLWCYLDKKIYKIKQNELKTRFYYIVLKSPQFKQINEVIYDNVLNECDKYYQAWKYALDGPFTRHILDKYVGKDISGAICQHLFEIDNKGQIAALDIDDVFWHKIKDILDGAQS